CRVRSPGLRGRPRRVWLHRTSVPRRRCPRRHHPWVGSCTARRGVHAGGGRRIGGSACRRRWSWAALWKRRTSFGGGRTTVVARSRLQESRCHRGPGSTGVVVYQDPLFRSALRIRCRCCSVVLEIRSRRLDRRVTNNGVSPCFNQTRRLSTTSTACF